MHTENHRTLLKEIQQDLCYGLHCVHHFQKSYVEALYSNVTVFRDWALMEVIKVK